MRLGSAATTGAALVVATLLTVPALSTSTEAEQPVPAETSPAHVPPPPTPGGPAAPREPLVPGPSNVDDLTVTTRPDGGTPAGIEVAFDRTSRTATGEKPAAASQFVFLFDKSLQFHPDRFPTCDRATLDAGGPTACPPDSQVGSGRAEFHPSGSAEVAVFNTHYEHGLRGVLITIPANGVVLENTFEPVSDPYRTNYRWASDELLPSALPPSERPGTTRFAVTFGASRTDHLGRHSFVESTAPPMHDLEFGLWSRFVTGQVALPTAHADRPRWNL